MRYANYGVSVTGPASPSITNSTLTMNAWHGLSIEGGSATVTGNIASDNGMSGIHFRGSGNPEIAGNTARDTRDAADRLTAISDGTTTLRSFGYDDAGRLVEATDAQAKTIEIGYDDDDRVVSIDDGRGQTASRTFDSRGNLTQQVDGRGTIFYVYDELNRMTQLTDPQSEEIGFDYDPEGNLVETTLPNGVVTTNIFDGTAG